MQATSHRSESVGSVSATAAPGVQDGLQQAQVEEWLSAYMDGELDVSDSAAFAAGSARLSEHLASAKGQSDWDLYHLIGDVVRTPDLALPVSAQFHRRLAEALEREPAIVAAPKRTSRRFMVRYGFPGLAAAAAVASVTWIAQPYFGGQGVPVEFSASTQPVAAPAVVPVAAQARPRSVDPQVDVVLGEYLDAHRQIAGRGAIRQVSATTVDSTVGQR